MADTDRWLAKVILPGPDRAALILRPDYTWEVTDEDYGVFLEWARLHSVNYRYGPADGQRGAALAHRVAAEIRGATVELPPAPPPDPEAVY